MFKKIKETIAPFSADNISAERKEILQHLVNYIQTKKNNGDTIRLNFICTHNSRRSHLAQIWAQAMAFQFNIQNVYAYSGGTEATAMFPKITETLINQGFEIQKLSDTENPVYAIKYAQNEAAVICFSKEYHHLFNPKTHFGAIMTCSSADEGCPIVFGAEARFPIKYDDPKAFDNTAQQTEKYQERSLEIAQEMWWAFRELKE
jgi:arsenate reductase